MRNEIIDQIENILYGVNMGDPQPDVEPGDSTGRVAARAVTRWLAVHDAEVAAKANRDHRAKLAEARLDKVRAAFNSPGTDEHRLDEIEAILDGSDQ